MGACCYLLMMHDRVTEWLMDWRIEPQATLRAWKDLFFIMSTKSKEELQAELQQAGDFVSIIAPGGFCSHDSGGSGGG